MSKSKIKYFLILCTLLLSVTDKVSTLTESKNISFLPQKTFQTSKFILAEIGQKCSALSFLSNNEEYYLLYCEEEKAEEDDDGSITHKKSKDIKASFNTQFYNWNRSLKLLNFSKVLSSYKYFTFFRPNKLFVVYHVFRV